MTNTILKPEIQEKLNQLNQLIKTYHGSIVAFSGGIDSSLLLYISRQVLGKAKTLGVISNSESLKHKDFELAKAFCKTYDIKLEIIKTREIDDERYNTNPADRCFYCKSHLYTALAEVKKANSGFVVLNGTNVDDFGDYRPGLEAAKENNIASPLADCKITKEDIRAIAHHYGLMNWDKPASPCLSSRVPYNQTINVEKLKQIELAENYINDLGFSDVRVRHYGDNCKIEVIPEEVERLKTLHSDILEKIQTIGFTSFVIDDEGLVSGKLNRALNL